MRRGNLLHTMTGLEFVGLGNKQELIEWVSALLAGKGSVLGREEGQAEGQNVVGP